ncbi:hypothetical protein H633G_02986 [Metarhizium anisopliae BRIP 53284]|nr:hypothetical protein H633G_02986 [Metarhizium anisopliae BRIP 53284]
MSTLGSEKLLRTLSSTDRLACKTLVNNISSHFPRILEEQRAGVPRLTFGVLTETCRSDIRTEIQAP